MLTVNNTSVMNFENALRGARNPMCSWNRMDSSYDADGNFRIGDADLDLASRLCRAGSDHRKFLRQIFVSVDITAPLYWWKEFDTYKVGTVANSTSTMHKLTSQPITLECFEVDDFDPELSSELTDGEKTFYFLVQSEVNCQIDFLESLRLKYLETKDKKYWKELIRWLPESWLQTRTITMNYENVFNTIKQRSSHKLNEWSGKDNPNLSNFISWARTLPYANELLFISQEEDRRKKTFI